MKTKKSIAVIICMALICLIMPVGDAFDSAASAGAAVWNGTSDTSWYDSEETELHISTAEEFAGFSLLIALGTTMEGQTIYLDNDIYLNDISDFDNWETNPPSHNWVNWNNNEWFKGTFDGMNNTIYGVYINTNYDCGAALFGAVHGTIKNLQVLEHIETQNSGYVGGIIGRLSKGTITNCICSGKINYYSNNSFVTPLDAEIGGLVGSVGYGIIEECRNDMEINVTLTEDMSYRNYCYIYVGGIAGVMDGGTIEQCVNASEITYSNVAVDYDHYTFSIGGICKASTGTDITNCYNRGAVTIINDDSTYCNIDIAGIVCDVDGGKITNTYSAFTLDCSKSLWYSGSYPDLHFYPIINTSTSNLEYIYIGGIFQPSIDTAAVNKNYYLEGEYLAESKFGISATSEDMRSSYFASVLGDPFVYNQGSYPLLAWEAEKQQQDGKGDVNFDGKVDTADVYDLQNYLLHIDTLTGEQKNAADMDSSGTVNIFDLALIKRTVA